MRQFAEPVPTPFLRSPRPGSNAAAWLALAALLTGPVSGAAALPPQGEAPETGSASEGETGAVETRHEVVVGGGPLRYTAAAGTLPIRSDTGETEGEIFYIAYTADGDGAPADRPLTFSFNGGPGSSSVWLHLGALGPRRVKMLEDGGLPAPQLPFVAARGARRPPCGRPRAAPRARPAAAAGGGGPAVRRRDLGGAPTARRVARAARRRSSAGRAGRRRPSGAERPVRRDRRRAQRARAASGGRSGARSAAAGVHLGGPRRAGAVRGGS